MIFSRKRGSGRHAAPKRERDDVVDTDFDDADDLGDNGPTGSRARRGGAAAGPYDISAAPAGFEGLDLGSLHVPVPPGVELRVQADPDGQISQVLLASGESVLQLGVFAAPRTESIWDEVREDIRKQLFSDGVAAEETTGEYGTEMRARVRTPNGLADIRFVGVDGPRWMVRAVYQGPAATDPEAATPLDAVLRGLVVDRGEAAMPVREPLPLRLPRDIAEQAAAQQTAQDGAPEGSPPDAGQGGRPGPDARRRPAPRPSPRPRRS